MGDGHSPHDFILPIVLTVLPIKDLSRSFIFSRASRPVSDQRIGKLLADASIFLACSMILAVFNISKVYKNGESVVPPVGQTTGTVR